MELKDFKTKMEVKTPGKVNDQDFAVDFTDTVEPGPNIVVLGNHMDIVEGLREMERISKEKEKENCEYHRFPLVSKANGESGCARRVTILQGQLGCCTMYGRTHFLPPGNYFWLGMGVVMSQIKNVDIAEQDDGKHKYGKKKKKGGQGLELEWKDISYVCLPENHFAVVQVGSKQKCVPSGRYLFRRPVTVYGVVDIQKLENKAVAIGIDEDAGDGKRGYDVQKKIDMVSGEWQKSGSLTFIRASPGFAYVIQQPSGMLRTGRGFNIARGGEVFKCFVDLQHYARTTRAFSLESKDLQEVLVRVQIRWCIVDAITWVRRKGPFTDIFDAVEEIIQSLLRDYIARQNYEECRQLVSGGYDAFEATIKPVLVKEIELLGGILLGFEMRSLRFPLLEKRNKIRAETEARMKEDLNEQKRQLGIDDEKRKRELKDIEYKNSRKVIDEEQFLLISKLEYDRKLQEQDEKKKLQIAMAKSEVKETKLQLEAKKQEDILKQKNITDECKAKIDRALKETKSLVAQKRAIAKAKAAEIIAAAKAVATGILKAAESEAKGAAMIGKAYNKNPQYLHYKTSQLQAEVLRERAEAFAKGLIENKGAMIPEHLQKEISSMVMTSLLKTDSTGPSFLDE